MNKDNEWIIIKKLKIKNYNTIKMKNIRINQK